MVVDITKEGLKVVVDITKEGLISGINWGNITKEGLKVGVYQLI